jgi:hypothetical protein
MVRLCDVIYVSDQILLFDLNMFQFGEFLRIYSPLLFTELGFKMPHKKQKSVNYLLPSSQKQCFSAFSMFSLHKHCDGSYVFLSFNCMT